MTYMIRKNFFIPDEESCRNYQAQIDRIPANVEEELEEDEWL